MGAELPPAHGLLRPMLAAAGHVTHLQVAVDGRWEAAARAFVSDRSPDDAVTRLAKPLRPSGECAIEVFARDSDGHVSFCGVRFGDIAQSEAMDVLQALWRVAHARRSLEAVADWFSERLGAPMFDAPCTAVEVGVVDAWRSAGPVRVFPADRGRSAIDVSELLLDAASRLPALPDAIVAAEFASGTPFPHWAAVEIARTNADGCIVARAPIRSAGSALAALLGND